MMSNPGYVDSTGEAPAELRSRLKRDGYLYIRDVLPPGELQAARAAVIDTMRQTGWGTWDPLTDVVTCRDNIWDVLDAEEYNDVFRLLWTHRDVYALAHTRPLLELLGSVLDGELFVHPLKVFRLMFPAAEDEPRWPARHQDFPELQGADDQLTMWMPLFPVAPGRGALPIYAGSHRNGILPLRLSAHPSGWEVDLTADAVETVGDMRPGDVLIFTTFTVHGGSANTSNAIRVSIDARYQPMTSPICVSNLDIPGLQYSLKEAFAHWPNDDPLRMYWASRHPPVVPFDDSWERWREMEAIRLGRARDPMAAVALRIVAEEATDDAVRAEAAELLGRLCACAET